MCYKGSDHIYIYMIKKTYSHIFKHIKVIRNTSWWTYNVSTSCPQYRYQTARTLLENIFGPKMHNDWPRKMLQSTSCGDGFWETGRRRHYTNKGIMLEVNDGQPVGIACKCNGFCTRVCVDVHVCVCVCACVRVCVCVTSTSQHSS